MVWFCADQAVALVPRDDDGHALVGVFGDQGCLGCPCYYEQAPHRWLMFQGPVVWGPRAVDASARILGHCHAVARTACGAALLGAGLPKAAAIGGRPAPFEPICNCRLATARLTTTRGIHGPGLRLSLLEASSHSTKWIQHTRAVVVNCTIAAAGTYCTGAI